MSDVLLVEGARTPHGTLLGSLADVEAVELATTALDGLLDRVDVHGAAVDWVSMGNAIQAGIGQVPARQAVVESALPDETPVTTVDEASGSGLRAVALAADRIAAGRADVALAGGFESMTNAPWVLPDYRKGRRHGDVTLKDSMILDSLWDRNLDVHMGEIAERLVDRAGEERAAQRGAEGASSAERRSADSRAAEPRDDGEAAGGYDLSREAQDRYALESHERAADAIESGVFDEEVVPVETPDGTVERDEGPRPDSTMADLGSLPTAFREDGTVTAGNASKLSDGAGAVALASGSAVAEHGLEPMAELVDYDLAYRAPDEFNEAVGDVVEAILWRNDLAVEDVDAFWINEAFAAQSVYVMERLGIPREKMNPLGGAVAFGHPIGGSGGMLAASLAHQIRRGDADVGLVGMSVGGGGAVMALLSAP